MGTMDLRKYNGVPCQNLKNKKIQNGLKSMIENFYCRSLRNLKFPIFRLFQIAPEYCFFWESLDTTETARQCFSIVEFPLMGNIICTTLFRQCYILSGNEGVQQ